ncbi:MAG TPA: hypothetical protein VG992_03885 [Candidatus Saccharimonadales bacterium]|nr:hypothetical protein [Candidatus Saccharimonadales bacterium]
MKPKHLGLFIVLIGVDILITYLTPVSHATLVKYHLSATQYHVLITLILLPLIIIYLAAFYGFSAMQTYVDRIKRDKDGKALQYVVNGLKVMVIGGLVSGDISTLLSYEAKHHLGITKAQIIFSNYSTVAITLAGLSFIYVGAVHLCQLTRKRFPNNGTLIYNLGFIALASVFTDLFVGHLAGNRHIPLTATTHAAYYSPNWLLVIGLLVPYLIAWYLGFLAIYLFRFYRKNIGAPIYERALRYVSFGLGLVISLSVVAQVLTIFTGQVQNLSTSSLILAIYALIVLIAAGYVPIAVGAKRLLAIEKV